MGTRCFKLSELADMVGGEVAGDASVEISGVAGIREARTGDITFVANPKYEAYLATTAASAVIAGPQLSCEKPLIHIENPYLAYLKVLSLFAEACAVNYPRGVNDWAYVDPTAVLGADVSIGPFCTISAGAKIGARTTVLSGTFVGEGVEMGEDCLLYPNVTVREGTCIGHRVILQPGAVIGADGFGFAKDGLVHHKVPQIGRVVLEDDVEVGANTCVDRATTGETRVRRGTKIDNLVQIAHNVVVGENGVIAAQVGISGSTEIESDVVLAGQAGLVGHINVGRGAMVGAQAGVTKSIPPATVVSGYPAREHSFARRIYAHTAKLPELFKRVKELEEKLQKLEKGASVDSPTADD